ncbi:formate--tetrahydrofolate ligase [Sandaracinus amylolyticus]|uniref:formate--tetrahydrofolate ligase n=1 Tax=Sandaracinus amylolyticus TaxID=927083 RepID=UPI001F01B2D5|nr:formate--tetrahydrofolate ligase [Sandaracinus amylolyticus]UJR79292.1 Formate--tetrahydrofolate ligase [Sandaracinus amylolyticus]
MAKSTLRPITDVAKDLGLHDDDVIPYGRDKAKIDLAALSRPKRGKGKVVLVSAITPTPAGEGKTTTSIGLTMGLVRMGRSAVCALREPSLGPVFGVKGGGTGGGKAQIVPANEINLHFTGDLHAITSANNLLAAIVDNELHFNGKLGLDPRRVTWRRAMDMNDRSLRDVVIGLGGRNGGVPRESGFDITAASEVMAVLCLADSMEDLQRRLGRIVIGRTFDQRPVTVDDLEAAPALTALLKDALLPNLAQTMEGSPALVHGGPFANIAHGCSSVLATKMAMHQADIVVTEGGFGFDLGAEKFLDIKCRTAGIWPSAVVVVATLRALKFHGGVDPKEAGNPNPDALARGIANLERHLETARFFGLKAVVAINAFDNDSDAEIAMVAERAAALGAPVALSRGYSQGGAGAMDLAEKVAAIVERDEPLTPKFAYELDLPYAKKIDLIAKNVYGADGADLEAGAKATLEKLEQDGYGGLPVCIAKTQLSVSDDPKKQGRPTGFRVTVREARLSAGAGFVVALLGDVMTMPGLPKVPAARNVRIEPDGTVRGLMQND